MLQIMSPKEFLLRSQYEIKATVSIAVPEVQTKSLARCLMQGFAVLKEINNK
jgi:hypothetical protein